MNVLGKTALITGGATGVGRATGLALARLGCSVAVNHIAATWDEAAETVAQLTSLGVKAFAIEADVTDDGACREMASAVVASLGRLDILVNCAGVTRFIPHAALDDVHDNDWDFILGVNVKGTFHCARACRSYLEVNGGVVINVASTAGLNAAGSSIPYAVSKAGVVTLTTALARVMAPKIRVNAVAPGFIDGAWLRKGLGERFPEARDSFAAASALGRVCQPEDIADAIVSLITGSEMVTGQTLVCDGGALLADPASHGIRTR
jgi:3-oxoacyl-[acyl-carrier protein] reductase